MVAAVVLTLGVPVAFSYVRALARPGHNTLRMRSGLWLREHYMSQAVDTAEWCWYTIRRAHAVRTVRPTYPTLRPDNLGRGAAAAQVRSLPTKLACSFERCDAGEGAWRSLGSTVDGAPVLYATYFRPDPEHPQVWVAAAITEPTLVRADVVAGTREPHAFGGAWRGSIPTAERTRLIAAFNSGFRFDEAAGGFYAEGRVGAPLRDGSASLVVYADGHANVGAWGADLQMGPDVAAVRQNLELIVAAGHSVAGLDLNVDGQWGAGRNQGLYTWRSGLGITETGALVYVAGDGLTLYTLAEALAQSGCVRAMELDIHDDWVTFEIYVRTSGHVVGAKLLPTMASDERRFLLPDDRDFVALFAR
jgi:Phosphodiester glycosidase